MNTATILYIVETIFIAVGILHIAINYRQNLKKVEERDGDFMDIIAIIIAPIIIIVAGIIFGIVTYVFRRQINAFPPGITILMVFIMVLLCIVLLLLENKVKRNYQT